MSSLPEAVPFLPPARFVGVWLREAVPLERCQALIAQLEERHFVPTGLEYPRGYRNNDRLVFGDPELSEWLFGLTRERLPARLERDGSSWQLAGLNSRFRACRYSDGQAFCVHRDGPYVPADDRRSLLTLQLYLNDGSAFTGGRTRFYSELSARQEWAALLPEAGAAIVFDHRVWHDGEAVTRGAKFVLRTDVIYTREPSGDPALARRHRDAPPAIDQRFLDHDLVGRHRGYVWRALVLRDGSVASAGRDGTVRRSGGERTQEHQLGAGSIMSLAEAADGQLWYGTRSGHLGVIDRPALQVSAAVLGLAPHLDGVAAALSSGEVLALDARGSARWARRAHQGWAWCVESEGSSVLSGGEEGRLMRTGVDGRSVPVLELEVPVRALRLTPERELLVGDGEGWLHRLSSTGVLLERHRAHELALTSIACGPGGLIATGSEDGRARCWRGTEQIAEFSSTDFVTSVDFTAQGELLWAGYEGAIWKASATRPSP